MTNKHIGSSFDDFLKEEGVHEDATAVALNRVQVWQITEVTEAKGLTKTAIPVDIKSMDMRTVVEHAISEAKTGQEHPTFLSQHALRCLCHALFCAKSRIQV